MADKVPDKVTGQPQNPEADKKAAGGTKMALEELGSKVQVVADVSKEIGNLYKDFKELSWEQTFERFKGIFAIAFIGMLSWREGYEAWKEEHKKENEDPNLRVSLGSESSEILGARKMLPDDDGNDRKIETREEALGKERFANMAPPTKDDYDVWYEINGQRVRQGTKGAVRKWALKANPKHKDPKDRPSEFAVKNGPNALFEKTPATYQEFEDNVIEKIFPLENNREKAIEKAAVFLSRCALGRFQILAKWNFPLMGWEITGKAGLENMYKFMKEPQRQVDLFNKIIASNLKNYGNDPIAASISYYGGSVKDYLKEKKAGRLVESEENGKKIFIYNGPKNAGLNADQRGGGTVLSYANKALREFQRSEGLGYNTFERTMMAVEWVESKGKLMNQILSKQTYNNEGGVTVKNITPENYSKSNLLKNDIPKPEIKTKASGENEIIQDKGTDASMNQFIEEELKNKEGAKLWAENLEGNGDRTVLTYVPPGVDLKANNLKIIYHFHGTHSQNVWKENPEKYAETVGWNRLKQTVDATDDLAKKGENVILVYPLSKGPRHKPEEKKIKGKQYDRLWMAKNKIDKENLKVTDDFDKMHQEILRQTGIKQEQISKIEAQGHSAGGLALANIATSGTKLINAYRFLDASYSGWAENCYDASRSNGKPDIYLLVAPTSLKTWPINTLKKSARWAKGLSEKGTNGDYSTGIDGVYYHEVEAKHAEMPGKLTGWTPKKSA